MVTQGVWSGPNNWPPDWQDHGDIDGGIFLFLLNNPQFASGDALTAVNLLLDVYTPPPSSISISNYQVLATMTNPMVYYDGSVLSTATFCTYDQNWIIALYNFFMTVTEFLYYNYSIPLPDNYKPIVIAPRSSSGSVVIAMAGDGGDGQQQGVISYMASQVPDCMIHLGDVYYSGTPSTDPSGNYIALKEEYNNFVSLWPTGFRSFTLNSNHEMYSGANGLFKDALLNPKSAFYGQGPYTVFALSVGDWTVLGLDSAYNSEAEELFMYGSLEPILDIEQRQVRWVQSLNLNPQKTIVLTHHTGFDYALGTDHADKYTKFWGQINKALGGDPYAWYWGHVHNAIIYSSPITIGTYQTNTYCRCLGNGSLPYGTASTLAKAPYIDWYAGQGAPVQLLPNGYATLRFEFEGNTVSSISESFFLMDTPGIAKKSNVIFTT
jgi:hypothetical protein